MKTLFILSSLFFFFQLNAQELVLSNSKKTISVDTSKMIRIETKEWKDTGDYIYNKYMGKLTQVDENGIELLLYSNKSKSKVDGIKKSTRESFNKKNREIISINKDNIVEIVVKRNTNFRNVKKTIQFLTISGVSTIAIGGYVTNKSEQYIPLVAGAVQLTAVYIIATIYKGKTYKISDEKWMIK